MAQISPEEAADVQEDITKIFAKFRLDMGFTAPELIEMRVAALETRVRFLIDGLADLRHEDDRL